MAQIVKVVFIKLRQDKSTETEIYRWVFFRILLHPASWLFCLQKWDTRLNYYYALSASFLNFSPKNSAIHFGGEDTDWIFSGSLKFSLWFFQDSNECIESVSLSDIWQYHQIFLSIIANRCENIRFFIVLRIFTKNQSKHPQNISLFTSWWSFNLEPQIKFVGSG